MLVPLKSKEGLLGKRRTAEQIQRRLRDADADVSALEREIDELVYALYGLTLEEIKIVQGATK
jgi:hypothetical protein